MAMNVESEPFQSSSSEELLEYRALSIGAVVSLLVGLASAMTIPAALTSIEACLLVLPVPIIGLIVGLVSWRKVRQMRDELTGGPIAAAGTLLSGGFLVGSLLLAVYTFFTEVPDGYQRISFQQMRPDDREKVQGVVVPEDVMQQDGRRVFLKGYMRPSEHSTQLDSFLLVRDNNTCCFGDLAQVKFYDQVQVELADQLRTDYSPRVFRLGGTLRIDPTAQTGLTARPVYLLIADYLK